MLNNEGKFKWVLRDLERLHWIWGDKTLGQMFLEAVDNDAEKLAIITDEDLVNNLYRKIYSSFQKENVDGKAR